MKTIAFDLDDVICWHRSDYDRLGIGKYRHCEPIEAGVELVNEYYDRGYKIIIYTARGMGIYNGDVNLIYETKRMIKMEILWIECLLLLSRTAEALKDSINDVQLQNSLGPYFIMTIEDLINSQLYVTLKATYNNYTDTKSTEVPIGYAVLNADWSLSQDSQNVSDDMEF